MITTEDVYVLINYVSFVEALFTTISVTGLIWMRYKQPNLVRPIKVNSALPIIFFIICTFLVIFPCYVSPWEVTVGMAFAICGIPVYLVAISWKSKPSWLRTIFNSFNRSCAKLFMCVTEEASVQ